jgi:histone deacetylase 6
LLVSLQYLDGEPKNACSSELLICLLILVLHAVSEITSGAYYLIDMRPLNSKKCEAPSHTCQNYGDQAFHGKCQSCDGVGKPSHSRENGVSLKEHSGKCDFNCDHADALLVDGVKGSPARSGHVDSACCDHDGFLDEKNGSCMACDDQESDREQGGHTLDDLFLFNDEEDDDIDWEPSARLVENRWFCLNCTVPNLDEVTHCQVKSFSIL